MCPCGNPIPPARARYPATRYCSPLCQYRYKQRNQKGTEDRFANAVCETCGKPNPQPVRPGRPAQNCSTCIPPRVRGASSAYRPIECRVCRRTFKPRNKTQIYCSKQCRERQHGKRNRPQPRTSAGINVRSEWHTRKLKAQVLATHGPTCWICNQPIPMEIRWPHPQSFSVDHILNVSEYPDLAFDPSNAKPAHLTCNTSRGAREGNEARKQRQAKPIAIASRTW